VDVVDPFAEFVGTFHHERRHNLICYMLSFNATPEGKKEIVALLNKHGMLRSEAWKAIREAEERLQHGRFVPLDVKASPFATSLMVSDLRGTVTEEIRREVKKVIGPINEKQREEIVSIVDGVDWKIGLDRAGWCLFDAMRMIPPEFFKGP